MNMRITKEYRPIEGINSRSENRPDITNQKAIEIKESVLKNLSLFKTDQQQIEYLKEYVCFKNDEHDISFYLAQHIHETNLFWNENCSDINTLDNGRYTQSFRQIQIEIHNKGCLDVYLDWQGHLITNTKKFRNGNILLLHELAQIYKHIKKLNIQESEKPQATQPQPQATEKKENYILEYNSKMKADIKKLESKGYCKIDPITKKWDFNKRVVLIALVEYWRHTIFDVEGLEEVKYKHVYINDTFLYKGKNPKINKNVLIGKECQTNFEKDLNMLQEVINFDEKIKTQVMEYFFQKNDPRL